MMSTRWGSQIDVSSASIIASTVAALGRTVLSCRIAAFFAVFAGLLLVGCKPSDGGSRVSHPLSKNADEIIVAGAPAVPFELDDLNGKKHALNDFRGKVVMLNLWASWCAPCVAEMPAIERLQQSLRDQGLVVLAVNVDSLGARKKVAEFVQANSLSFPILLDHRFTVPEKYLINGFPETVFIDRNGKILLFNDPKPSGIEAVARIVGDRPWDSEPYLNAVRSLLN